MTFEARVPRLGYSHFQGVMESRPKLMSHEDRMRLIRAPISFFSRYESDIRWGGAAIESHPSPRRAKTPADQDDSLDDEQDDHE